MIYFISGHRGSEIQEWLDKQTEPYRYVILDDDSDMSATLLYPN